MRGPSVAILRGLAGSDYVSNSVRFRVTGAGYGIETVPASSESSLYSPSTRRKVDAYWLRDVDDPVFLDSRVGVLDKFGGGVRVFRAGETISTASSTSTTAIHGALVRAALRGATMRSGTLTVAGHVLISISVSMCTQKSSGNPS